MVKFRKMKPRRRYGGMRKRLMKSGIGRAFLKSNLQRHISKTVLLNGENQQQWFYNVMYANNGFSLNMLPNLEVGAIQELYDYYRIDGIKLEFYPQWNSASGVNGQPEIGLARLTHAVDTNVLAPPANEIALLEHRNVKAPLFTRVIKKYFKPEPQVLVQGQAGNPGSTNPDVRRNPWIPTAEAAVPHFGCHWIAQTLSGVANETSYRIIATFYMTFKGQQ